ncbi:C4-dicarboxylate transporter [Sporosarcina sp. NCCP-2716]|uniref:tellurite resistance/C4-dicarboxylate transporter family protein n=1 Tax=Sporosarcina sp. NCCP-2716 TaxID=2943679 RepID=UPI00203F26C5|nr:tellurite resistance/C4-dicarboxylate transporter family protein [Sporosarcina sp. NCCP-2716]GKV68472.1 C4-dicarboxylate transporter [Sporosarcina sp. NCCP-2716]
MTTLLEQKAKHLFPGSFAAVMATGALGVGLNLLGFHWTAPVLIAVNTVLYTVLWILTIIRLVRYPRELKEDLVSHSKGAGFFTIVAGTAVFGSQLLLTGGHVKIAMGLLPAAAVLWVVIMYTFFTAMTIGKEKPSLEEGFNGTWLLSSVATQSIAVLGTLLSPYAGQHQHLLLFSSLSMYFLGCMLYLPLMALLFYRFTFVRFREDELSPPYWISMGALAIATLSGSALILHAEYFPLLEEIAPFLKGFTLFFWITGTWWIPLLVILTVWHYGFHRPGLSYNPQIWSMVFPLAMYTAGTYQFANALHLPFVSILADGMAAAAAVSWAAALLAMLVSVIRPVRSDG